MDESAGSWALGWLRLWPCRVRVLPDLLAYEAAVESGWWADRWSKKRSGVGMYIERSGSSVP
jgi:hypothetical protein